MGERKKLVLTNLHRPQISACPLCKRAFVDDGKGMCPKCHTKEESMRIDIASYVREYPKCTASEVIKETGARPGLVRRMMQEGVLKIHDDTGVRYPCSKCGTPIIKGKFCTQCAESLQKEIAKTTQNIIIRKIKLREKEEREELEKKVEKKRMHILEALKNSLSK